MFVYIYYAGKKKEKKGNIYIHNLFLLSGQRVKLLLHLFQLHVEREQLFFGEFGGKVVGCGRCRRTAELKIKNCTQILRLVQAVLTHAQVQTPIDVMQRLGVQCDLPARTA